MCCQGHSDVIFGAAMCTDCCCGAFVLLGGGSGFFAVGTTNNICVECPGLAGSTANWMNFLFMVYLAPKLVCTW